MEKIYNIYNKFQNINQETIVNIVIAIIFIISFILIGKIIAYFITKIFKLNKGSSGKIKESPWYQFIKTCFFCAGIYFAILILNFPEDIINTIMKLFKIIVILLISRVIVKFLTPESVIFKKLKSNERFSKNEPLTNFVEKISKYIVYFITVFIIISELGYDLSGLITGLGLGGVVIALAAQDIAKNLFGGIAIILDKPFSVGDWVHTEKCEGTIEDITFRSTRIRATDSSVITIPNSIMSNEIISNFSRLQKRRIDISLKFPLEINSEDLENITQKIEFILKNNTYILEDSIIINVSKINDDNIEIDIIMYTNVIDYNEFLELKQGININILKVLESENIKLAYPGRNIYVQK